MVDRTAFDTQWRVACPDDHVRLEPANQTATAYCETCGRSYDFAALVDRRARPAQASSDRATSRSPRG